MFEQHNHFSLLQFPLPDSKKFSTKPGDRIGFQCGYISCPVSMEISPSGNTYVRRNPVNTIGKTVYNFKGPVAVTFSIGVDILPSHQRASSVTENNEDLDEYLTQEHLMPSQENVAGSNHDNTGGSTSGISQDDIAPIQEMTSDNDIIDDVTGLGAPLEAPLYTTEQRQELLGATEYLGNNLTLEDEYWQKEGRKTFIDTTFTLKKGILKGISLFVHDIPFRIDDHEIFLELWGKDGLEQSGYRLDWQKQIRLTHGTNQLYEVSIFLKGPASKFVKIILM